MLRFFRPRQLLIVVTVLVTACVYVPRTTETYDPECQYVTKHMDLEETQFAGFAGCQGRDCLALLAAAGVVAAASVVVSGSIVVTGNVVYWLEKKGRCQKYF